MENKEMNMEDTLPEKQEFIVPDTPVPGDDAQGKVGIDSLSGMPILADKLQENIVEAMGGENVSADEEFSLSEFYGYIEDNTEPENRPAARRSEKKKSNTVLSYLHDLVFGLVAILLVFMLLFHGVVVSGPSMQNTLVDGDYIILLSNVFYRNPQPGDIIVASKDSFRNGEPIIKRVIATEGQRVDINFVTGIVYVDGVALEEPYTKTPTNLYEGIAFPLIVDEGCVFVMGDNRNDSKDSRSPEIGLIDCREIVGKALFLALPGKNVNTDKRDFNRIGALW